MRKFTVWGVLQNDGMSTHPRGRWQLFFTNVLRILNRHSFYKYLKNRIVGQNNPRLLGKILLLPQCLIFYARMRTLGETSSFNLHYWANVEWKWSKPHSFKTRVKTKQFKLRDYYLERMKSYKVGDFRWHIPVWKTL